MLDVSDSEYSESGGSDPESGEESEIEEDPDFPLPRQYSDQPSDNDHGMDRPPPAYSDNECQSRVSRLNTEHAVYSVIEAQYTFC